MKRLLTVLLSVMLVFSAFAALADLPDITVYEIQKYGNLLLSLTGSEFLNDGYAFGDIVTVTINGQEYDMPVGSNYSDVDQGKMIFRVAIKPDTNEDYITIAINMGNFATTAGLGTIETTDSDPGYVWHLNEGVPDPIPVTVAMKQSGGYYDQWVMHQLVRSDKREDYPNLTDAEFANFRPIRTTGVGEGKLYRSSSPVNPELGRNLYADKAAEEAGIKTVINLADTEAEMKNYEGFADSYYSKQAIIPLNLGVDFTAEEFCTSMVKGLRFIAENDGPYLVHCTEGKERCGYVSAFLESLMGASADEVIADYMVTFYNYYDVLPGTEKYDSIASSNIAKTLTEAFGLDDIKNADLAAAAEKYLIALGMSTDEISAIRAKLGN
ncbi:MAG: tyrosine-protein phosphatase [Clostridia bacterium]|nr:tyrosine-protein phosphatase [Clostridia bacterium]